MIIIFIYFIVIIMTINFCYIVYSLITGEVKALDLLYDNWEYANFFGKFILISGFIFLIPSTVISSIIKLAYLFIDFIHKLGFSSETALERHIYSVNLPDPTILDYLRKQNIEFIIGKEKLYLPSKSIKKKIVRLSLCMDNKKI